MSTVTWTKWPSNDDAGARPLAWHQSRVPYTANSNELQNIDIWVPYDETSSKGDGPLPRDGLWLIYIHGGAWRDPMVNSSSFDNAVRYILSGKPENINKIAGLASINYSLSPYPSHSKLPAPVPGPGVKGIPSRSAKHPEHIIDVLTAIDFLDEKFAIANNYVLTGHSCGATLAFQVAMDHSRWTSLSPKVSGLTKVPKPVVLVGLNGLYDLPALIADPGEKHMPIQPEYKAFTILAFGEDTKRWATVCPTSTANWSEVWPEGKQVVLVQSHEDTLVPYSQTALMFENLRQSEGQFFEIGEMSANGDHNELWQKGDRLAEILVTVVDGLS